MTSAATPLERLQREAAQSATAADIAAARQLIASARLSGEHDRDLLTAIRILRNALAWDPASSAIWQAGADVFARQNALYREAGEPVPRSSFRPPPDLVAAMARAKQLSERGERRGAIESYSGIVKDYAEWPNVWKAGLAAVSR
jgi:hypothetical protein